MQHTAAHLLCLIVSVLQCVAVCCSVLQCLIQRRTSLLLCLIQRPASLSKFASLLQRHASLSFNDMIRSYSFPFNDCHYFPIQQPSLRQRLASLLQHFVQINRLPRSDYFSFKRDNLSILDLPRSHNGLFMSTTGHARLFKRRATLSIHALLRNMHRSDVAFKTRSRAQDPSFSPLLAQTNSTLRSTKSMSRMGGVREGGVGGEERRNNKTLAWQNSHKSQIFLRAPHMCYCRVSCLLSLGAVLPHSSLGAVLPHSSTMTVSSKLVTSPKPTKSRRHSNSSVLAQSQSEFESRDTGKSEFLDLVDFGGVTLLWGGYD